MDWLQKLPGSKRSPPGLERQLWRSLPMLFVACTVIPLLGLAIAHLFPSPADGESLTRYLTGVRISLIALVITLWTALFTIAIGCVIVMLMKGPAYVADRYPLADSESPDDPPS